MDAQTKPKVKYDGPLNIAVGKSRTETNWKNREMKWSEFAAMLSTTTRTRETVEEFRKMTKPKQGEIKDVGGFCGGTLKGGRRISTNVAWRQVVTLDADFAKPDFWFTTQMMIGDCASLIYSTHTHTAENCRLRLVIPLSRPVTGDEYQAISRKIAYDIGIDVFDGTTFEPHRLMYWPSTSMDGEFEYQFQDGPWMDADEVLGRYDDWRDQSMWPEPTKAGADRKRLADKQGDPLAKTGLIGAYCRTYSIQDVLEKFLSGVYTPCANPNRYTYSLGTAAGGLVIYEDKFCYSNHGTDPISGKLVNAFDLIRIHKFGDQDENADQGIPVSKLPSYISMMEFATQDNLVKRTLGEERLADANDDFGSITAENWLEKLEVSKIGQYMSTAQNIILILSHDPNVAGKITMDDFAHRITISGDLPWRGISRGPFWNDTDDAGLRNYLSKVYSIKGVSIIADALAEVLIKNACHPVKEYLDGLVWDGVKRADTVLIDYLAAPDNEYTRAVTRKTLLAAVARIYQPGIKWDDVLVLLGHQGAGKSQLFRKLAKKWFSDSFTTFSGKEAYEQLQGQWIIELGEMTASTKAESEVIKHFISKQDDTFRVAYGRQLSVFKRQNIFVGTTNNRNYLKDKTGNRRFRTVEVQGHEDPKCTKKLFGDFDNEVDQIWAEMVVAWESRESLYLDASMEEIAREEQECYLEESTMAGPIREYLNALYPKNWADMDIPARRNFIHNNGEDFAELEIQGTEPKTRTCALEIWVELYKGDVGRLTNIQSREINDILRMTKGWESYTGSKTGTSRFGKIYGIQRAFQRI